MLNLARSLGLGMSGAKGTPIIKTNIYVDSVGGLDSNNGLTSGAAKQTIAGIPMANGIIINLKRGSKWRETLDTSAYTGMTVQDYGAGALPILDCSDVVANSGWTQPNAGTYPNVWQKTITTGAAIATMFASMWVNNTRLKWIAAIATVNTTVNSFTIASSATGQYGATTTTFQVNTGGNPNTDGKVYEYAARNYGFSGANSVSVSNIHTRRNAHNNGSFVAGSNATVNGCMFEDGSKHNAYVSPGTVMNDCIAWKCDWQAAERDGWIGIVSHASTLTGVEQTTFNRCQVIVDIATLTSLQNGITGFYCHTDGSVGSLWGRITYNDCTAVYCQTGFDANDCLGVTHNRSHTKGCLAGISVPAGNLDGTNGSNAHAANFLTDCWLEESDSLVMIRGVLPDGLTTTIDGLRIWQLNGGNDGMIYGGQNGLTIKRSAFSRAGSVGAGYFQMVRAPSSNNAIFQNNVLWGPNTGYGESMIWMGTATIDHNAYAGGNSDMQVNSLSLKLGPYMTAAQAAGSEAGSVSYATGNPFTNSAAGDFSLTGGSGLNPATYGLQRFPTYQTIPTPSALAAM